MDVFAHGLWSYAILRKSKAPGLVIVTGMLPDLIPFIPYFIHICIKGIKLKFGPPPLESIPNYVFTAYNLTHSLVIITLIFGLIFILTREIPLFLWAWPIHIAMDILTHAKAFFPTKFLYPLSEFHINGINWGARWFMIINYGSLLLIYFVILYPVPTQKALTVKSGMNANKIPEGYIPNATPVKAWYGVYWKFKRS